MLGTFRFHSINIVKREGSWTVEADFGEEPVPADAMNKTLKYAEAQLGTKLLINRFFWDNNKLKLDVAKDTTDVEG